MGEKCKRCIELLTRASGSLEKIEDLADEGRFEKADDFREDFVDFMLNAITECGLSDSVRDEFRIVNDRIKRELGAKMPGFVSAAVIRGRGLILKSVEEVAKFCQKEEELREVV